MKLVIIIMITCLMQVSASTFGQKVTLSEKNATLENIFLKMRAQTGYDFLFDAEVVKSAKPIDIRLNNAPLDEALKICLKGQNLEFTIDEKSVIVRRSKERSFIDDIVARFQQIEVRGKVVDSLGNGLAGATVSVKNGRGSTSTDAGGNFVLRNVDEGAVLVVNYLGYVTREVVVIKGFMNVTLQQSESKLDEVQIMAYGTTSRRLSTGNIVSVKAEDIAKQSVNNPLLTLQGRVSGMTIQQTSGIPGAGVKVQIRGQNSLNGSEPLYIVDGIPIEPSILGAPLSLDNNGVKPSTFQLFNNSNIESIDILKDADATSIYGSRGANGVILITTKKGSIGDTKINLNASTGLGSIVNKMDLLNLRQYLDMRYEALKNDNVELDPSNPLHEVLNPDLLAWDTTRFTNWQDKLIGGTAHFKNVNVSLSGGVPAIQYLIGGGFQNETSVFPGKFSDIKGNVNLTLSSNTEDGKLTTLLKIGYLLDKNTLPELDFTNEALRLAPNAPSLFLEDGSLNWENSTWINPLAKTFQPFKFKNANLTGALSVSYNLLPNLLLKTDVAYNNIEGDSFMSVPFSALNPATRQSSDRRSSFVNTDGNSWLLEPQISYNLTIGKGTLGILFGSTFQTSSQNLLTSDGNDFDSDAVLENLGAAKTYSSRTTSYEYKYSAAFIRLNYNLDNTYIVNLTGRRDGSSRFGPGNQFGNFGSMGAAWIFANEEIVKRLFPYLSYGKLRTSYGTSGNDQIGNYEYLQLFQYSLGSNLYQGIKGLNSMGVFNPYFAWETTKKLEASLDLGFLNDNLLINTTYYVNRSGNQLIAYPLPSFTGPGSARVNSDALIQNSGLEASLSTVNFRTKSFSWSSNFNITFNRNKLLKYPNLEQSGDGFILDIGQPLNRQRVFDYYDVDPATGAYRFKDRNEEITYNPNLSGDANSDLISYINTFPKFFGGIQNNFILGRFTLDFLIQYTKQTGRNYLQGQILPPGGYYAGNQPINVLKRWQKNGDKTDIQRFNQDFSLIGNFSSANNSTLSFSDASYIRLKNLYISYDLPISPRNRQNSTAFKLYLQSQNLFTITNYIGLDPETQNPNSLPPLKTVTIGLQLTL